MAMYKIRFVKSGKLVRVWNLSVFIYGCIQGVPYHWRIVLHKTLCVLWEKGRDKENVSVWKYTLRCLSCCVWYREKNVPVKVNSWYIIHEFTSGVTQKDTRNSVRNVPFRNKYSNLEVPGEELLSSHPPSLRNLLINLSCKLNSSEIRNVAFLLWNCFVSGARLEK